MVVDGRGGESEGEEGEEVGDAHVELMYDLNWERIGLLCGE